MSNDNVTHLPDRDATPEPEFIRQDEYGRTIYFFCATYTYENAQWSVEFWAYSLDDAKKRCAAMRSSLGDSGVFQILAKIDG